MPVTVVYPSWRQRQTPVVVVAAATRVVSAPVWGDAKADARDPWSVSDSVLVSGNARIVDGFSNARFLEENNFVR